MKVEMRTASGGNKDDAKENEEDKICNNDIIDISDTPLSESSDVKSEDEIEHQGVAKHNDYGCDDCAEFDASEREAPVPDGIIPRYDQPISNKKRGLIARFIDLFRLKPKELNSGQRDTAAKGLSESGDSRELLQPPRQHVSQNASSPRRTICEVHHRGNRARANRSAVRHFHHPFYASLGCRRSCQMAAALLIKPPDSLSSEPKRPG